MAARALGWQPSDQVIAELSLEQARALAARRYAVLDLGGVKSLSPEIAETLAMFTGKKSLEGLTALTPDVADSLAKQKDDLYLIGLTTLSDEAAKVLLDNPRINVSGRYPLQL